MNLRLPSFLRIPPATICSDPVIVSDCSAPAPCSSSSSNACIVGKVPKDSLLPCMTLRPRADADLFCISATFSLSESIFASKVVSWALVSMISS